MDMMLAPITTYVNVSNLLVPRIILFVICIYYCAAWAFQHALSFMLATIFSHQYKQLDRMLEERIADGRTISDSEIESLRQHHQHISISVTKADDFLKFSNAGAFCCQLFGTILLLYALIFYHSSMTDPVVMMMRVLWIFSQSFGLSVTTAGGIMVNHYVSNLQALIFHTVIDAYAAKHNAIIILHTAILLRNLRRLPLLSANSSHVLKCKCTITSMAKITQQLMLYSLLQYVRACGNTGGSGGQSGHVNHPVCQWDLAPQPSKIFLPHKMAHILVSVYSVFFQPRSTSEPITIQHSHH